MRGSAVTTLVVVVHCWHQYRWAYSVDCHVSITSHHFLPGLVCCSWLCILHIWYLLTIVPVNTFLLTSHYAIEYKSHNLYQYGVKCNFLIKEHQDACRLYRPEKSAVAERAWCNDHQIDWDTVEIVDTASKKMELLVKEAIHIQRTPKELLLNRDNGWQIPESWNATLRTDMTSSREARRPEQSVDREAQAMEMDSWQFTSSFCQTL